MIHSYTSLSDLDKCPRKYSEIRVYKNYKNKFKDRGQLTGLKIHDLVQSAFHFNERTIHSQYPQLQPMLDTLWKLNDYAVKHSPHPVVVTMESEHGIDRNFKPSPFWDKTDRTWYRDKPDWYLITGSHCCLRDLKSGSSTWLTDTQLTEQAVLINAHHPEVTNFNCGYLFADPQESFPIVKLTEGDLERYRNRLKVRCDGADEAERLGVWEAKPSGLCGYCVVDSCDHYQGYGA